MLTTEQINEVHRLYWSERWPIRKIERHLRMGWRSIEKYLKTPVQGPVRRQRTSKLDPFKDTIAGWLEKDPDASATVIEQRLRQNGYDGAYTILREYLKKVRPQAKPARAFLRVEPAPGERFEVGPGSSPLHPMLRTRRRLLTTPSPMEPAMAKRPAVTIRFFPCRAPHSPRPFRSSHNLPLRRFCGAAARHSVRGSARLVSLRILSH